MVENPFVDPVTGKSLADSNQRVNTGTPHGPENYNPVVDGGAVPVTAPSKMASLDILTLG